MRGDGRVFRRGNRWWIAYYVRGREYRESAGKTPAEAKKKLRERLRGIYSDQFISPRQERVTVEELLDSLEAHLEVRGVKSLRSIRSHLKPVRDRFGHIRAVDVAGSDVEEFARERLREGKATATVNRELQPLKQAFNLAVRRGSLIRAPYIRLLKEDNARQGFFEHEEFRVVVSNLPEPIDDVARFAYLSGWRKGEILPLLWRSVDRSSREVRLRTSKNGRGRVLPLDGMLWEVIVRRWAARKYGRRDGSLGLSDHVFHHDGAPIKDFKRSWRSACRNAGCPGKLFHDLRRTAVRNMVRAGVPQSVAMAISGHRTVSMFLRYNITSDEDLRRAVRQVQLNLELA